MNIWPSGPCTNETWLDNEDGSIIANSRNTGDSLAELAKPRCKIVLRILGVLTRTSGSVFSTRVYGPFPKIALVEIIPINDYMVAQGKCNCFIINIERLNIIYLILVYHAFHYGDCLI